MTTYPLAMMLILNLMTAVGFALERNWGMTIIFTAYATACGGFIVVAHQ